MKVTLYLYSWLCICQSLTAQQKISIEPLSIGIQYIVDWHNQELLTERNALANYKEKQWYNIIPWPALGYNMATNKPMVTFTLPDIPNYITRKKDLKYRLQKVSSTTQQSIVRDTSAYRTNYIQLQELIYIYQQQLQLLKNDSLLFAIKVQENKKLQATTEEVIKTKASLQEKELNLHHNKLAIWAKVAAIEGYLHRNFIITFYEP